MQVQVLNNFKDNNFMDKVIEGLNALVTSKGSLIDLGTIILIPTIIIFIASLIYILKYDPKKHVNEAKIIIYLIIAWVILIIVSTFVSVIFISYNYEGAGNYKTEVKPYNIKQTEIINGNYKYNFEVKDEKNNSKVKLEYQGHKFNKNEKIQVKTQKKLLKGSDPKHKSYDLQSDDNYTYSYQGHKLKVKETTSLRNTSYWKMDF